MRRVRKVYTSKRERRKDIKVAVSIFEPTLGNSKASWRCTSTGALPPKTYHLLSTASDIHEDGAYKNYLCLYTVVTCALT